MSCGVLIDSETLEVYPYLQAGVVGRGLGVSATASKDDVSTGWGANLQGSAIVAAGVNLDFSEGRNSVELGGGTPGVQGTVGYTWNTIYDLDNLYNTIDRYIKK